MGYLFWRFNGGVSSANQRAHAAASNGVDRDAIFLKPLEDSDVRQAERASAFEDQANARSMARCWGGGRSRALFFLWRLFWSLLRPQIRHKQHANRKAAKLHGTPVRTDL